MNVMEKQSLQKFTEENELQRSPVTGDELKSKFIRLLSLKGEEYTDLYNEIESSLNETGKNILWNNNALIIKQEIVNYINTSNHGLPTATTLALKTQLSRATVTKHLKELYSSSVEEERISQHKHLFDVILTNIGRRANSGDIKCAKLYLETMVKVMEKESIQTYIQNQQNNFIMKDEKK